MDFLIHDRVAIEVKARSRVSRRDYKGILALTEELDLARRLVVCDEARWRRDEDGIEDFSRRHVPERVMGGEARLTLVRGDLIWISVRGSGR